jgi:quercetin dioxygenase-like cupin family protein
MHLKKTALETATEDALMIYLMRRTAFTLLILAAASTSALADEESGQTTVVPLLTHPLAGISGKEAMVITVEYSPGAVSGTHRHNANTFVYVLEGSIEMQVAGGKVVTLTPGQTFYESPTDIHSVSRNASKTQPAKFLVFFVKDQGASPTVPVSK